MWFLQSAPFPGKGWWWGRADTRPHLWQQGWYDGTCSFQNKHINGHQKHSAEPHLSISTGDLVVYFKIFGEYSDTGNTRPTSNFCHIHLGVVLMASIFTFPLVSWPSISLEEFWYIPCTGGLIRTFVLISVPHSVDPSGLLVLFSLDVRCLVLDC